MATWFKFLIHILAAGKDELNSTCIHFYDGALVT